MLSEKGKKKSIETKLYIPSPLFSLSCKRLERIHRQGRGGNHKIFATPLLIERIFILLHVEKKSSSHSFIHSDSNYTCSPASPPLPVQYNRNTRIESSFLSSSRLSPFFPPKKNTGSFLPPPFVQDRSGTCLLPLLLPEREARKRAI